MTDYGSTDYRKILSDLKIELLSCLDYLQYSYDKGHRLNLDPSSTDPDNLETFEALVSRFARADPGGPGAETESQMRITEAEVQAFIKALTPFLPTEFQGELLLYGSRTDDSLRGGDIDLILLSETTPHAELLARSDYKIVAAMKTNPLIGDRKIDFKVLDKNEAKAGFFFEALKTAVSLARWP